MIHLVCGGSGFIGRHLVEHLRASKTGDTVHTLDRSPGDGGGPNQTVCDLTLPDAVSEAVSRLRPDFVYHMAGTARVNERIPFDDYFRGNFLSTIALAGACEKLGRPVALFLASSVHVYGNRTGVTDETAEPRPSTHYAFSKYLAEQAVRQAVDRAPALRAVIGRLYTCIGPGQAPGFVAADFCRKLAALPADADGLLETGPLAPTRRFLDVRDAVRIFVTLLEAERSPRCDLFNIASPHEVTVRTLLETLISLSGKKPRIAESPAPGNPFTGLSLSTAKLEGAFPVSGCRPLRDTLREMYEWEKARVERR